MKKNQLSDIPQIETLLQESEIGPFIESLSRPIVAEIARSTIDKIRRSALGGEVPVPPYSQIVEKFTSACRYAEREKLQKVVNATGIIIHTNMGRAPLLRELWREAEAVNCGYSNLELDLQNGKRGKRKGLIPRLLSSLLGVEDALVVNNNAAAVFLILNTFARSREVIVNRGEQVQIGGGFRIPEILSQSGAQLVEIGTTNITTQDDYLAAFSEQTAMVLSVHRSNFTLRGFTAAPSIRDLSAIKPDGVLLCVDQGSGVLDESLPGETSVRAHINDGADLVSFSADRVLGGPQAGIIVGRQELISQLEKHPLMRVFRPGKTIYSLLEAGLIRRLNGVKSVVSGSLELDMKRLRARGNKIIHGMDRKKVSIVESTCATGGGSSPDESFPSLSVRVNIDQEPVGILRTLREAVPPIIGTVSADRVHLNLVTIQDAEILHVRTQLHRILGG